MKGGKEVKYLKANHGVLSNGEMATALNRTTPAIHSKVSALKLNKRTRAKKLDDTITIRLTGKPIKSIVKLISVLRDNKIDFSY